MYTKTEVIFIYVQLLIFLYTSPFLYIQIVPKVALARLMFEGHTALFTNANRHTGKKNSLLKQELE
jgi:hypothetical protein